MPLGQILKNKLPGFVLPEGLYRPDIDGLRALAVLSVLFFHFSPDKFASGFIGVDIFFVISGYLITGILVKSFEKHHFNKTILDFYVRRIRRIFPAALAVLILMLIAGWLVFFPSELKALTKHIVGAAAFAENLVLWQEAGYFDVDAVHKPLLHFWSLAVEEQFYIFWPLILWVVLKKRWPLLPTMSAIIVVSFVFNLYYIFSGQTSHAFYLPFARAWELLIGGWFAIAAQKNIQLIQLAKKQQAYLGLLLIILGFIFISHDDFPGFWALLPVFGTALIINAGHGNVINDKVLSFKPVVFIGLISYPLYLWHWSLWSFANIIFDVGTKQRNIVILLSFIFAWLTYLTIEKPLRHRAGHTVKALIATMLAVALVSLVIYFNDGIKNRPLALASSGAESYTLSIKRSPLPERCHIGDEGPWYCSLGDQNAQKMVLAIGDSHAQSMLSVLDEYGKTRKIKVIYTAAPGCLELLAIDTVDSSRRERCLRLSNNMAAFAKAEKNVQAIIYVQRWAAYGMGGTTRADEVSRIQAVRDDGSMIKGIDALRYGFEKTLSYYQALNIPVLFIQDNPQQKQYINKQVASIRFVENANDEAFNQTAVSLKEHLRDQKQVNELMQDVSSEYNNAYLLNTDAILCTDKYCPWVENGQFLYFDDDHLSLAGSMKVYPFIAKQFDVILLKTNKK